MVLRSIGVLSELHKNRSRIEVTDIFLLNVFFPLVVSGPIATASEMHCHRIDFRQISHIKSVFLGFLRAGLGLFQVTFISIWFNDYLLKPISSEVTNFSIGSILSLWAFCL